MPAFNNPKNVVLKRLIKKIDLSSVPEADRNLVVNSIYDDFYQGFKGSTLDRIKQIEGANHAESLASISSKIEQDLVYSLKYTSIMGISDSLRDVIKGKVLDEDFVDFERSLFLIAQQIDSEARLKKSEIEDEVLNRVYVFMAEYLQKHDIAFTQTELQDIVRTSLKKNVLSEMANLQSAEADLNDMATNFNDSSSSIKIINLNARRVIASANKKYPNIKFIDSDIEDVFKESFNPVLDGIFNGYSNQYHNLSKTISGIRNKVVDSLNQSNYNDIFEPLSDALGSLDKISASFTKAQSSGILSEDTVSDATIDGHLNSSMTWITKLSPNLNPRISKILSNTSTATLFNTAAAVIIGGIIAFSTGGLAAVLPIIWPLISSTIIKTAIAVPLMTITHDLLGLSKDGVVKPDSDFNGLINYKGPGQKMARFLGLALRSLSFFGKAVDKLGKSDLLPVRLLSYAARFVVSFAMWGNLISIRDSLLDKTKFFIDNIADITSGLSSFDLFSKFGDIGKFVESLKLNKLILGLEDSAFPLIVEMFQERIRMAGMWIKDTVNNMNENMKLELNDSFLDIDNAVNNKKKYEHNSDKLTSSSSAIIGYYSSTGVPPPSIGKLNTIIDNMVLSDYDRGEWLELASKFVTNDFPELEKTKIDSIAKKLFEHAILQDENNNLETIISDTNPIIKTIAAARVALNDSDDSNVGGKKQSVIDGDSTNIKSFILSFNNRNPGLASESTKLHKLFTNEKLTRDQLFSGLTDLKFA